MWWNSLPKWQKTLVWVNALVIGASSVYYVATENFEFLVYVVVLLSIGGLVLGTIKRSNFPPLILWGLSIWGWGHMAGGSIPVGESVLYRLILVPLYDAGDGEFVLLKYDQAIHFYGFAIATLIVYHLLKPYLNERTNWKVVYPIIALCGMGLGVVNELVEFLAVISVPETGVGGYFNTSLDLVFNTLGAIAAVFYIHARRVKRLSPESD